MTTTLWQRLQWPVRTWSLSVSIFLGTWVVLILWLVEAALRSFSNTYGTERSLGQTGLILITCGFLFFVAWLQALTVSSGARVFRHRPVPKPLWRGWLERVLLETTAVWMMLMLICLTLPRIAASPASQVWSDLHQAALFSVVMGFTLLVSASYHRLLHWVCGVVAGAALLCVGWAWQWEVKLLLFTLSAPALWVATAVWPMVAVTLWLMWRKPPQMQPPSVRPIGALWRWVLRYTPLRLVGRSDRPALTTRIIWGLFVTCELFIVLTDPPSWGASIPVVHFVDLALTAGLLSDCLVCKDFHWRRLLAPSGIWAGRLGSHIFQSSVGFAMVYIIPMVMGVALHLVLKVHSVPLLEVLANAIIAAAGLLFALSLAVLVRTLPKVWEPIAWLLILGGIALLACLWYFDALAYATPFTFGPAYLLTLFLLTALNITLANRLWTVEKLAQYALTSRSSEGLNA